MDGVSKGMKVSFLVVFLTDRVDTVYDLGVNFTEFPVYKVVTVSSTLSG